VLSFYIALKHYLNKVAYLSKSYHRNITSWSMCHPRLRFRQPGCYRHLLHEIEQYGFGMGSSGMKFLPSLKFKLVTQLVHFLFRLKLGKRFQNWVCIDANEMGPLFLKEVLNLMYSKTGIRNNFGAIRRTGTVLMRVPDELQGAAWTSATQRGNFSSCNMQLFYTLRALRVCWTWDSHSPFTRHNPLCSLSY
jgi:hypothetical protein